MIIKLLLDLVLGLISVLLAPLPDLPAFPESLSSVLDGVIDAFVDGCGILSYFVYWDLVVVLLDLCVAAFALYEVYALVLWFLRKIPMAGID